MAVGASLYDFAHRRTPGRDVITARRRGGPGVLGRLTIAPGYPLDATIRAVAVDGREAPFEVKREGDIQRPEVPVEGAGAKVEVAIRYTPGSDAYARAEAPAAGARSEGLRILRSRAEGGALVLTLEGLGGRSYPLRVRSPRRVAGAPDATVRAAAPGEFDVEVAFDGPVGTYVRRKVVLPLR